MTQTSGLSGNAAQIASYLRNVMGLSDPVVAGIEGNLEEESGFSTTAANSREGAIGLAQWEGGRRTALDSYAAAHGLQETDLAAQLGYMTQELQGPFANVLQQIRGLTSPSQVASIWDAQYEISSGSTRQQRINYANQIYNQLNGSKLPPVDLGSVNGGVTDTTGSGGQGITGGTGAQGIFNPLSSSDWLSILVKIAFTAGGITLVLLGAYRAAAPVRDRTSQILEGAAA